MKQFPCETFPPYNYSPKRWPGTVRNSIRPRTKGLVSCPKYVHLFIPKMWSPVVSQLWRSFLYAVCVLSYIASKRHVEGGRLCNCDLSYFLAACMHARHIDSLVVASTGNSAPVWFSNLSNNYASMYNHA